MYMENNTNNRKKKEEWTKPVSKKFYDGLRDHVINCLGEMGYKTSWHYPVMRDVDDYLAYGTKPSCYVEEIERIVFIMVRRDIDKAVERSAAARRRAQERKARKEALEKAESFGEAGSFGDYESTGSTGSSANEGKELKGLKIEDATADSMKRADSMLQADAAMAADVTEEAMVFEKADAAGVTEGGSVEQALDFCGSENGSAADGVGKECTVDERAPKGDLVGELDLVADGNSSRKLGDAHVGVGSQAAVKVKVGCLPFHRSAQSKNDLPDLPGSDSLDKGVDLKLVRTYTVHR